MPIFEQFPYTNLHELNLDWIIKVVKEWGATVEALDKKFDDLNDAFNDLKAFVNNYFDNLDVQEEINNKLDEMAENGDLIRLLAPYLPFVTPEMFGAVGDGVTDDTEAIRETLNSEVENIIFRSNKIYLVTEEITATKEHVIEGNNAKIVFSEDTIVSDLHLLKFYDLDYLTVNNLNFEIKCTNSTPFPDSELPNTGGMLVRLTDCSNVTFNDCSFYIIDNGTAIQCTCFWATGTGKNYLLNNCKLFNRGNASQGGCIWFFGNLENLRVSKSTCITTTLDELITAWGNSIDVNTFIEGCYLEATRQNTNILATQNVYSHLFVSDCIIKENDDYICYTAIKSIHGEIIVDNCTMYLYGSSTNRSICTLNNDASITIKDCLINLESLDSNDNTLVKLENGTVNLLNNNITLKGIKRCFLVIDTDKNNSFFICNNNIINFDGNVNSYIYGYDTIIVTNNTFNGKGAHNFDSYISVGSYTRIRLVEGNNYLCSSYGGLWTPTGKVIPFTESIIIGQMNPNTAATIPVGNSTFSDMRLLIVRGYSVDRYAIFLLIPSPNNWNVFKAEKLIGSSSFSGSISGTDFILSLDS
ncbi:MAG: hypothetical protein IKE94_02455, partial [Aeriscardovia sp.]|nr:hypothetical protein [Aeriscardovia sp.]